MLLDRGWLEAGLLSRLVADYGLDPDRALAAAADRLGLGPIALFAAGWYRQRNRLPLGCDAFGHYMDIGAAARLDPHPLFSVSHYLQQAPEAGRPGVNPLLHFLEVGGPAGLDSHPLFLSRWYWDTNLDVLHAGMIPIVHFLKYGSREGREPNPLFCRDFYLGQCSDSAVADNPFLHFVLAGNAAGLSPHPSFRPQRVLDTFAAAAEQGALPAYLAVVGHAQPKRARQLECRQAEPGIVPGPMATAESEPGATTRAGVALLQALDAAAPLVARAGPTRAGPYQVAKLRAIEADPDLPADLAAAMAAGKGALSTETLLNGVGLVPRRRPQPPPGHEAPRDILERYEACRFETAGRFRLDPSRAGTAPGGVLISIIMPVYRPPLQFLERAVLSVICQTYPDWELCLVDDCSGDPGLSAALARLAARDRRIKLATSRKNGGIAQASNRALALAAGDYVGLLDHDDMLTADALAVVAEHLRGHPDTDLVYSDECTIDGDDIPAGLFTKPDWSPLLLTSVMYTGHFSVYRTALVRDLGGFRSEFDFSQDYDLALRVAERQPVVKHLRHLIYGWRMIPGSASAGGKPAARASNIAALQAAVDRRGWEGGATALPFANRVVRAMPEPKPLVSIVLPSDNADHVLQAVMSIVAHTTYDAYEIVVVANPATIEACGAALRPGRVRFVRYDKPFNFSEKCNEGAQAAAGAHLVFFNDDVRVLTPGWLEAVLECLTLPGVGAVAPKLLYEDNSIQHAGMITGTRRLVSTAFHRFPCRTAAHYNLAQSAREVSLLSGACLAVAASTFAGLGGFDAVNTPIAHSDVDLCLRLRESGLSCVYTPHAELTHIGHVSIGQVSIGQAGEGTREFRPDKADIYLMRRFGGMVQDDPYFPPGMRELLAIGDQHPFRYRAAPRAGRLAASRGDALLVSHDLSGSGAPKIVFDMARTLVGAGWYVLVMSPEDGPYRDRLLALGADVMIEPGALEPDGSVVDLARNFDVVVGNTVLCWRLMPALARFTRVFLYAHETGLTADLQAAYPDFNEALRCAHGVWAGSERAAVVLREAGVETLVLEYGVEAPEPLRTVARGAEINIALLATIEPRKGQDLAVKAFRLLPPEVQARCRLGLNGRPHDLPFTAAIQALADCQPRVSLGPELDFEDYRRALSAADIVLCPSRDDTLPLVSLNALAEGKVLVCSREVGTASYIEDGVSGFILEENRPAAIARMLARVVAARRRWPEIGEAARQVFRDNFSEPQFERRLRAILEPPRQLARAAE